MERLDIVPRQFPQREVCNRRDSGKGILHPVIELVEKELKALFSLLLLGDVRVRAKPSKHSSLIVLERLNARQERTEASIGRLEWKHHFEWLAILDGSRPAFHQRRQCIWINHDLPAPACYLLGCCPGVIVTPLIIPVDPPVRVREPHP